jgi:hypothetical protein
MPPGQGVPGQPDEVLPQTEPLRVVGEVEEWAGTRPGPTHVRAPGADPARRVVQGVSAHAGADEMRP